MPACHSYNNLTFRDAGVFFFFGELIFAVP